MPASTDKQWTEHDAWRPHPAVLLLLWACVTVVMQALRAPALLLASGLLAVLALLFCAARFRVLLRRTRWIMFSLLLIYGYATPGAALWAPAGTLSPTLEGLFDGLLQLCRLLAALAGLSLVLSMLTQQQLIGGLYTLAYPLRYVGVSRERIAVRLALTLHYAETAMLETTRDWRASMARMLQPAAAVQQEVELQALPFTLRDGLLLVAAAALLVAVLT
jgi:energy-coupling factor transport system permease protein